MSEILRHIIVPVANEADAESTCRRISKYLGEPELVLHFVHVIKKAGGAPDKAPLAQRQEQAEKMFKFIEMYFDDTGYTVKTELRYGTDVVDEILDSVEENDAGSVLVVPREGGFISKLLSGNRFKKIISSNYPVIVLPET